METIFWTINFVLGFIAEMITLYFYLSHDDLQRGKMNSTEINQIMKNLFPIEIGIYAYLTLFCAFHGNIFIFLICLPIFCFNFKILYYGEYLYNEFAMHDFTKVQTNEKILKFKLGFYVLLLIFFLVNFLSAFTGMMFYRIFK